MKREDATRERIQVLLEQELNLRMEEAKKRLPHLCTFNHRQPLDVRKRIDDQISASYNRITRGPGLPVVQTMGLCMLGAENPEEWNGTICEDPIDAQRCPYFNPKFSKSQVLETFASQIKDPEWLKANMPEVYGLSWSLEADQFHIHWWTRFMAWLFSNTKVEYLHPKEDLSKLLPP